MHKVCHNMLRKTIIGGSKKGGYKYVKVGSDMQKVCHSMRRHLSCAKINLTKQAQMLLRNDYML